VVKTTFADIKAKYRFENTVLANMAEVNPKVIQWMLTGQPVARWQAEQVLKVLTRIAKENYSFDTVEFVLHAETTEE
jgi:hypothetical protein